METTIDVLLHTFFCFAAGYIAYKRFNPGRGKSLFISCLAALIAGLFNDTDHILEYFFMYGFHFNFSIFWSGINYLTQRQYLIFHGYEYVFILAILVSYVKSKKWKMIFASMMLSHFLHLIVDSLLFGIPIIDYSIIYRMINDFRV